MTARPWRPGASWSAKPDAALVTIVEEGAGPAGLDGRRPDDRLVGVMHPDDAARVIVAMNQPPFVITVDGRRFDKADGQRLREAFLGAIRQFHGRES